MKKTTTMYAVGWATFGSQEYPSPLVTGAWAISVSREAAENIRADSRQKIVKVLVTIETMKEAK